MKVVSLSCLGLVALTSIALAEPAPSSRSMPLNGLGAVSFSGLATVDSNGNISSSGVIVSPISSTSDDYDYGRVNPVDGSTLEFNLITSGSGMIIQGIYVPGLDVLDTLKEESETCDCGLDSSITSLEIDQMGTEPMASAASVIGNQPFKYAIVSGELGVNGVLNAPY